MANSKSDFFDETPLTAPKPSPKPNLDQLQYKPAQKYLKNLREARIMKKTQEILKSQTIHDARSLDNLISLEKAFFHPKNSSVDSTDSSENFKISQSLFSLDHIRNDPTSEDTDEGNVIIQKPRHLNISVGMNSVNFPREKNNFMKRNPIKLSTKSNKIREKLMKLGSQHGAESPKRIVSPKVIEIKKIDLIANYGSPKNTEKQAKPKRQPYVGRLSDPVFII